jgi:alanine dehydrogenase
MMVLNGNFPTNRARHGLPTIQGAVFLADASNRRPLALIDSMEVTLQRTGAATAVAARYLARPESTTATICGCGEQGSIQLFAWDIDRVVARAFAGRMSKDIGIKVESVDRLGEAARVSDAIVTCTSAKEPFLGVEDVRAGTFIAAVGADNPAKSEIKPELMAKATVVVDVPAQAAFMGDLHHAITAGAMTADGVHAGHIRRKTWPARRVPGPTN